MSLQHHIHHLSVDELLERAASVANLAKLRTYAEPSPIQIATITEYTSLLESMLGSLPPHDASTRRRILAQLDIHRSILAPIRRIPVELLSEIFFQAAYQLSLRTLQVSVTIARVCGIWREVAHGCRGLWSRVVVRSIRDFEQYLELFLPLAREDLLELRCDSYKILWDLWDRIEPYASRWRSITLEGRLRMLPDLKVLYMENLERLIVDAYDVPHSSDLGAVDFVVAPRLRHISLTLDALQSKRQLHVPVTRALTSLEITSESPFPITLTLPLLQACADTLKSVTIRIRRVSGSAESSYLMGAHGTFVMQDLTYLSIADPACALLDYVTAPLIRQLVLSNVPAYASRFLRGFLERSQAWRSLLILRVYKPEEREISAWIPCLQLMDRLLQLHFDDLLSNKEFLELLTRHPDRPTLLPSLQAIAMSHIFRKHLELRDTIAEFCNSRETETTYYGRRAWTMLTWIRD